jgi:hypothetical protein
MTVLAHVGGVPVEELIPSAAGTGTALVLARAWAVARLRRGRRGTRTTSLLDDGARH